MPNPAANPARIFLVDDHDMVREGLATVLTQAGFAICGQAGTIRETLAHPALASAALVVVDLSLDEGSGLDLLPKLQARRRPALVYSMHEDSNVVRRALAAGASGYVTKREVASCLVEAIHRVLAGERYVSPRAGAGLLQSKAGAASANALAQFSDQQQRIYALLGEGLGTDEIAERLRISPRTVESYAVRMIDKLNLDGMRALRRHALGHRAPPLPGLL